MVGGKVISAGLLYMIEILKAACKTRGKRAPNFKRYELSRAMPLQSYALVNNIHMILRHSSPEYVSQNRQIRSIRLSKYN